MSLDFPNRNDWLKVRATPRKLPGRYTHVSARLAMIKLPNGTMQTIVARPGSTLNVGSTQRKRKAFVAKKAAKAEFRETRRHQREAEEFNRELDRAEAEVASRFPAYDDRDAA